MVEVRPAYAAVDLRSHCGPRADQEAPDYGELPRQRAAVQPAAEGGEDRPDAPEGAVEDRGRLAGEGRERCEDQEGARAG
ncbi:hypothetical protein PMKS-002491 [Pichia membranifaciens]|uniref:Uncharacterized protein n=1 Tax=Pichia membranifaciens TaxID=4926 RepID=A0A1Q2YHK6_9ASCO|nr:hypothetical protein PMKS-002491 [Pichia membranifaciens]